MKANYVPKENKEIIPAGQTHSLLSERRKRKLPKTTGHTDATKVQSPISRGI